MVRHLVSTVQLAAMPDVALRFRLTPVDYVARAIVELSLDAGSQGRAYNLVNLDTKSFRDLHGFVRDFGYEADLIPLSAWKQRLFEAASERLTLSLEQFRLWC